MAFTARGMAWHVLVITSALRLPYDSGSRSGLPQGTRITVHVLRLPLGKGLGLCLVGPAGCRYPQFCFHPICPSQSACQQLVEVVVLQESQGLGQES